MANVRYEMDFRVPTERDSKGNAIRWSNSMRTIVEATDETKAKMLLRAQYSGVQIAWCNRKS